MSVDFEAILNELAFDLGQILSSPGAPSSAAQFEELVRNEMRARLVGRQLGLEVDVHPHQFPDLVMPPFGLEVKYTASDSWRCVGNSISEGLRPPGINRIYALIGKAGGEPAVRWKAYGDAVVHVRTSHVPRFELDFNSRESLFHKFSINYDDFSKLSMVEKMHHVREYARGRLDDGEQLWWLGDDFDNTGALTDGLKLYTSLDANLKRKLRAEGALLCPEICCPGRKKGKYDRVVLYFMAHRAILCHQARDLFSAGSVAGPARGGNYLARSLTALEPDIEQAARELEPALFATFWGEFPGRSKVIDRWLELADSKAKDWVPSQTLFVDR